VLEEDERSRTTAEWYKQMDGTDDACNSSSAFESALALESDDDDNNWTEEIVWRLEPSTARHFSRRSPPPKERLLSMNSVTRSALLQQYQPTARGEFLMPSDYLAMSFTNHCLRLSICRKEPCRK